MQQIKLENEENIREEEDEEEDKNKDNEVLHDEKDIQFKMAEILKSSCLIDIEIIKKIQLIRRKNLAKSLI